MAMNQDLLVVLLDIRKELDGISSELIVRHNQP